MIVEETLKLIEKYASKHDVVYVDFSGGKDSIVTLHLVKRVLPSSRFKVLLIDKTILLPGTIEFVKEVCEDWGLDLLIVSRKDIDGKDFEYFVLRWGFPKRIHCLWCWDELTIKVLKWLGNDHNILHITGIRRSESRYRRIFYREYYHKHHKAQFYVLHPILDWDDNVRNEYLRKHNLPIIKHYDEVGRSGCFYCPFVTSIKYYIRLYQHYSKCFMKIIEWENKMRKGGAALWIPGYGPLHLKDLLNLLTMTTVNELLQQSEKELKQKVIK